MRNRRRVKRAPVRWRQTVVKQIKGKYATEVLAYANGVADGTIVAGEDRILGCRRFLNMLSDPQFEVRTQDADFVIGIIEKTFKH